MMKPPHAPHTPSPIATQAAPSDLRDAVSDVIAIRKYPNRRLYDTSQSRHLTHDGVIDLVLSGKTVQVTDSRTGSDITTIVLLQILIERDPLKLLAIPPALLHSVLRSETQALRERATAAIAAWSVRPDAPERQKARALGVRP